MGASITLGAVAGCRWEKEEILPFAERPEGRTPGQTERYATAIDVSGAANGLHVTTVDGRPIKIEGNPDHPQSGGATDAQAQAAVLEFYDPDRSAKLSKQDGAAERKSSSATWDAFVAEMTPVVDKLVADQGAGLAILATADSSPTRARLAGRLRGAMPKAQWVEYAPVSDDNRRAGAKAAFGQAVRSHASLGQARVIVCLDADLLGTHPSAVRHARDFAATRDAKGAWMSRLYAVEPTFSITGAAADHRLPLPAGEVPAFAAALEEEVSALVDGVGSPELDAPWAALVRAMAKDLVDHRGNGVVAAGRRQSPSVHAAAHRLNAKLGNVGKTVFYTAEPDPDRPSHVEALRELVRRIHAGEVTSLLILGGNPLYDAPADLEFAAALAKVATSAHLSLYRDETSRACTWHLPQAHFLETWGDARSFDGTYSVIQPTIAPLYDGKSAIEVLALLLGIERGDGLSVVRETFDEIAGASADEAAWRKTVHDGFLAQSDARPVETTLAENSPADEEAVAPVGEGKTLELLFCPDASVFDGRFANNAWLQETPRPMTQMTWGNAALIAPKTAKDLGVLDETIVKLHVGKLAIEIPALVMPGQAPGSITVQLGYGRTAAGHVGGDRARSRRAESVGVDVFPLRTSSTMDVAPDVKITSTGRAHALATTQDHHAIDRVGLAARAERVGKLVREATLEHFHEHPDFARHAVHHPPLKSLWDEPSYEGRQRWGMTIDLGKCIGCNACVVACQAENNVPVVGRKQVLRGREMHWLRVDRYFNGDPEDPSVATQPVACHQCELAPCEQVCPVAATTHSAEGLNDMAYNRCIGTRYCANNCPYKVRRFNYFNFHKDLKDPANEVQKMMYNPEVTVRSRGVMEKCTYCVQRIQAKKIEVKNKGRRRVADTDRLATACQQACPSGAILFGDLGDETSRVATAQSSPLAYAMLSELNIKPRTYYLARIRNPNPALEGHRS